MKKLFRIKNESSVLGGVSLGLSEYFNLDVTLIRLLFILGFFTPVPTVIIYLFMWVIMPVRPDFAQTNFTQSAA